MAERVKALVDSRRGGVTYVPLTPEEIAQADVDTQVGAARQQQIAAQEQERSQLRATYIALRDGTGTAAERIRRLELVMAWMMRRDLGAN